MADKSDKEIALELARLAQDSFQNRRSFEWKVAFALWSGIALFTAFLAREPGLVSGWRLALLFIFYLGVLATWFFLWQIPLRRAFDTDKQWKHYYMHKAEGRADNADPRTNPLTYGDQLKASIPLERWRGDRKFDWWAGGQSVMTAILLAISLVIVSACNGAADRPEASSESSMSDQLSGENLEAVIKKLVE